VAVRQIVADFPEPYPVGPQVSCTFHRCDAPRSQTSMVRWFMRGASHESGPLHALRPTGGASTRGGRATHPAPEPDLHSDLRDGRDGERLRHPWPEGARRYRLLLRLLAGWNAPRRSILGMVLAGDVESVGRNVTSFKEGDPVFGMSRWVVGAYAEAVCWPVSTLLAPRPQNLSYEEAAALRMGACWRCIACARPRSSPANACWSMALPAPSAPRRSSWPGTSGPE